MRLRIKYRCFRFILQIEYPYYPSSSPNRSYKASVQMSESDYAPVGNTIGSKAVLTSPELKLESGLSFLDLVILSLLDSSPMTGYVLKKRLVWQYRLKASFGTLYPRLKTLQKEGILKDSEIFGKFASRSSGTNYQLTPLGRKILDQNLRRFDGLLQKIRTKDLRQPSF